MITFSFRNKRCSILKTGNVFVYSKGNKVHVHMDELNLVREICQCKSADLGRNSFVKEYRGALVGTNSILTSVGSSWIHQRKILAPEFFMNKVKVIISPKFLISCVFGYYLHLLF